MVLSREGYICKESYTISLLIKITSEQSDLQLQYTLIKERKRKERKVGGGKRKHGLDKKTEIFFNMFCFVDKVSCIPGWP